MKNYRDGTNPRESYWNLDKKQDNYKKISEKRQKLLVIVIVVVKVVAMK